jgi:hypothetical protein
MKNQARMHEHGSGRGWLGAILALAALCLQPTQVTFADEPQSAPPASSDDENIDISRLAFDSRPSIFIQGNIDAVYNAFLDLQGIGGVSMELLDPVAHTARFTFHGNIALYLDPLSIVEGNLLVGIAVPRSMGSALSITSWGGRSGAPSNLNSGHQVLPLAGMNASGALAAHPLHVSIFGSNGSVSSIQAASSPELIVLTQIQL